MKSPNKAEAPASEAAEGSERRPRSKENTAPGSTSPTQSGAIVSPGLERVREKARKERGARFTALFHPVTVDLLRASFWKLQKNAAAGVDGMRWREYATGLEERLADLHSRVQRGAYRARPSRRVYIPKADGRQRPLGIAALEDKIVQQAVVEILNAINEETEFLGFSYGFRPGRGTHDALDALSVALQFERVSWALDADIRSFFDQMSREWTMEFVQRRIGDPRLLRLIQKWLKAGVSEEGEGSETTVGTPQGAVLSPLLANIYLHYVLDEWAHAWRQKRMGNMFIVRYADDAVFCFQHRAQAERFQQELEKCVAAEADDRDALRQVVELYHESIQGPVSPARNGMRKRGLIFSRAATSVPAQGRFTSPDSLPGWQEDSQSWNIHSRVGGSVIRARRPGARATSGI